MTTAAQELPQSQGPLTARRRVVFTRASGLHLRLADQLVRRAAAFQADIWLEGPGGRANGKSILDLMALAAACGTTLEIQGRGPDAEEAVAALAALIGAGFEASEEGGTVPQPRPRVSPVLGRGGRRLEHTRLGPHSKTSWARPRSIRSLL
jgi:phosphocarrier protein